MRLPPDGARVMGQCAGAMGIVRRPGLMRQEQCVHFLDTPFQFLDTKAGFCPKKPVGRRKMSMGRRIGSVGRRVGFMGRRILSVGRRIGSVGRRVRRMGRCVVSHFVTPQHAVMAPQKPGGGPQRRLEGFPGRQKVPYGGGMTPQKPGCCFFCLSAPPQRPGEMALGCGALSSQVLSEFSRRAVPSSRPHPSA